jgi:hypothetical protein
MEEWLINFSGRTGGDPAGDVHFLWRYGSIFISDNHRVGPWCWSAHLKPNVGRLNFLHVDRHDDTLWMPHYSADAIPSVENVSLNDFLSRVDSRNSEPDAVLFRHDNAMSLFMEQHRDAFDRVVMATHLFEPPRFECEHLEHGQMMNLMSTMDVSTGEWIIDVDLDYFTYESTAAECQGFVFGPLRHQVVSEFFDAVRAGIERGAVRCVTIILSPTYAGGWVQSENLCRVACERLGLDFSLPP